MSFSAFVRGLLDKAALDIFTDMSGARHVQRQDFRKVPLVKLP